MFFLLCRKGKGDALKTTTNIAAALSTLIFALAAGPALGATLDVPADHGTIQDAIVAASVGDRVLVAPGTYEENLDFLGKGILVQSEAGADVTIIDGGASGPTVTFAGRETVEAVLDGFTIRNGEILSGGGIHCDEASPMIANCTVTGNRADWYGGGISCRKSSPTITNCTITDNEAFFGSVTTGVIK